MSQQSAERKVQASLIHSYVEPVLDQAKKVLSVFQWPAQQRGEDAQAQRVAQRQKNPVKMHDV